MTIKHIIKSILLFLFKILLYILCLTLFLFFLVFLRRVFQFPITGDIALTLMGIFFIILLVSRHFYKTQKINKKKEELISILQSSESLDVKIFRYDQFIQSQSNQSLINLCLYYKACLYYDTKDYDKSFAILEPLKNNPPIQKEVLLKMISTCKDNLLGNNRFTTNNTRFPKYVIPYNLTLDIRLLILLILALLTVIFLSYYTFFEGKYIRFLILFLISFSIIIAIFETILRITKKPIFLSIDSTGILINSITSKTNTPIPWSAIEDIIYKQQASAFVGGNSVFILLKNPHDFFKEFSPLKKFFFNITGKTYSNKYLVISSYPKIDTVTAYEFCTKYWRDYHIVKIDI